MTQPSSDPADIIVPLHEEELAVSRQTMERIVRVRVQTTEHTQTVDEPVHHEAVEVQRVPVGRAVDAVPPVRTEGDTTIVPVVEEQLVIQRRLILKEEIHLRRIQRTERHRQTVTLRRQHAVVERSDPEARGNNVPAPEPEQEPLDQEKPHGL